MYDRKLSGTDSNAGELNRLKARLKDLRGQQGVEEGMAQLSVQQLATISDQALDNAYHYGRSTPGNTFGWQANLKSAEFAKRMIDAGETDIEKISDAIHQGWNVTARAFVQNPEQFDDTEKLRAAGKLDAKLQQREKLMNVGYRQLPDDEQEKDRVVARALLQAIQGDQDVSEGMDPDQRARLDDLIDKYRTSVDPSYDHYGVDDHYDPDDVISQIRNEFGDNVANKIEAGADKMHFPRQHHSSGYGDPLRWKTPVDRQTKAGKMYQQDSDYRKNTIRSRYNLSGKSSTEGMSEGSNSSPFNQEQNLRSKSDKELADLIQFWNRALEKNPEHKIAREQLGLIKMIRSERIGKKNMSEDHEIQMASSELQSIAKNAVNLLDLVRRYSEREGLQAWQQSKITRAADYLNAVLQSISGEQHDTGMAENFKDGRNPGRRGLAKRSGVNTKASVSALRDTARHSTGEKQRMAHWLANMKSGRAKDEGVAEGNKSTYVAARYIDEFADGEHWYIKGTQEIIQRFVQLANNLEDESLTGTEYAPGGAMAKMHTAISGDDDLPIPQWKIVPAQNLEELRPINNNVLIKLSNPDLSDGVGEFMSDFLWGLEEKGLAVVHDDMGNVSDQSMAEGSTQKYEMMLRNGQVKKFVAKDDADARRIAAGHSAKSVIRMKGNVPGDKIGEQGVAEAEKKGLYYYVNKRKKAGTSRPASNPKAPTDQAWRDAAKTAKKEGVAEGWSKKYKSSINCSHPKGFSQKAHCAGKKKHDESIEMEMTCPDCGMCETHGNHMMEIKQRLDAKCWKGKHKEGTKIKGGVRVNNCVPNESSDAYVQRLQAHLESTLMEKIPANAPVDDWVQDFQQADPQKYHQFRNKTPEQKAQMAVAASYAAKNPSKKK
jgi:hypothetical protein